MTIETRDLIAILALLVSLGSMVLVSRNARRATAVQSQNVDLARIRDLRQELTEAEGKADRLKTQIQDLARQLDQANEAAMQLGRERAEMLRYARMPGMDIDTWLTRFDNRPPSLNGTINP